MLFYKRRPGTAVMATGAHAAEEKKASLEDVDENELD